MIELYPPYTAYKGSPVLEAMLARLVAAEIEGTIADAAEVTKPIPAIFENITPIPSRPAPIAPALKIL